MATQQSMPIPSADGSNDEIMDAVTCGGRNHLRIQKPQIAARLLLADGGADEAFLIQADNISRGGLAFRHPSEIEPGQRCEIKIMLLSGKVVETEGKIARCRSLEGGGYEIGLQFSEELDL